jgi:hypothetical protein
MNKDMNTNEPLISRMSAESLERLERYAKNWPGIGGYLMRELNTIPFWTSLTYESITTLNDALDCGYRPSEISNLFSN